MTDSTISANIASRGGSGVYNGGRLGVKGAVMITDGVNIPSGRHLVQVEGALTSAQIQIEASDYVAPGSGAPIPLAQSQPEYPTLSAADVASFLKPAVGFRNWKVEANADGTQVLLIPSVAPIQYEISFHGNATCCTPASNVPDPALYGGWRQRDAARYEAKEKMLQFYRVEYEAAAAVGLLIYQDRRLLTSMVISPYMPFGSKNSLFFLL